ncbi:lipoprotein, partial [Streptomyces sp. NRRL S-444]
MVVHQHRRRRGRAGGAVLAFGMALTVAAMSGCGGPDQADDRPAADPAATVRGAADVLAKTGSAQARTAMEMATGGTRVTIRGEGGVDFKNRMGQLLV